MNSSGGQSESQLNRHLENSGYRSTRHRQHVYDVLMHNRDHPTAEEVFIRAKQTQPEISMATVYNCLDTLVKSGLVRLVHLDRGATRFCPNMEEHGHFVCEKCGAVFDIDLTPELARRDLNVPAGFKVNHYEIAVRGECPACAGSGI